MNEDVYQWLEEDTPRVTEWVSAQNIRARAFLDAVSRSRAIEQQTDMLSFVYKELGLF